MRLWHEALISSLPRQQLLGQHRELAALRGNGWGRPHATVNYVFQHSPYRLYQFHCLVMAEMRQRGYHPDPKWLDPCYRGQHCSPYSEVVPVPIRHPIYLEHDHHYLISCITNLAQKGIQLADVPSQP